ncbi:type II secretion system protein [Phycisphaera mikurensis]|nr:prepilin-type N-terminal cleavage/methylation domain-containing protein [Phycisphaera mikurensis]MBB6441393.1 type II secretion system protein G [Phycisphaera mikurensis]
MSHRNPRSLKSAGFTLVEILIVVVILGILAAIVIPQFTNASQAARASQLTAQLQTLRSQLELAQMEHQGVYPTLSGTNAAAWAPLTTPTQRLDTYAAAVATTTNPAGPYLQKPPVNAFFAATTALPNTSVGSAATNAWIYDATTGSIRANVNTLDAAKAQGLGLDIWNATTNPGGDVSPK